jgi:hypothetical protein
MARTFEYAVLTAVPNERRGERVNVGVVVFRDDRLDVRFKQAAYKLRALTGENWDERLDSLAITASSLFEPKGKAADALERFKMLDPLFKPSDLGWLSVSDEADYEEKIDQILASLVALPRRERQETKSRINTEITREFSRAKIMAPLEEGIEGGKVVRDFSIDPREGLSADFALQNGVLHVASTLDLRKQSANLSEAALKSIVLDKAERKYPGRVRKIGVYAVDEDMQDNFKHHINLLGDYADDLYNWLDPRGRDKFKKSIFDALSRHGDGLI